MARTLKTPGVPAPALEPLRALPSAEPLDGLPNAIDVDPLLLLGPVLTRQGWIVPPERTMAETAALRERLKG